jgi:hypothetical protein
MSGLNVTNSQFKNDKVPSKHYESLNPAFTADTMTACPCCQEMSLESAFQPSLIPNGTGYTLTHCTNPECYGYALTLKRETFLETMQARQQIAQEAGSDE